MRSTYLHLPDEKLVELCVYNEEDAWLILVNRYRSHLVQHAQKLLMSSRNEAEDVVQDALACAHKKLSSGQVPHSIKAWLHVIVRNRCMDLLRQRRALTVGEIDSLSMPVFDRQDPAIVAQNRESFSHLIDDLKLLPPEQRSVLLMRAFEGASHDELSERLHKSRGSVRMLLVRARARLARATEAREADCAEIRSELALSLNRKVKATTRAHSHMKECRGCRSYYEAKRRKGRTATGLALPTGTGLIPMLTNFLSRLISRGGPSAADLTNSTPAAICGSNPGVLEVISNPAARQLAGRVGCTLLALGGTFYIGESQKADPPRSDTRAKTVKNRTQLLSRTNRTGAIPLRQAWAESPGMRFARSSNGIDTKPSSDTPNRTGASTSTQRQNRPKQSDYFPVSDRSPTRAATQRSRRPSIAKIVAHTSRQPIRAPKKQLAEAEPRSKTPWAGYPASPPPPQPPPLSNTLFEQPKSEQPTAATPEPSKETSLNPPTGSAQPPKQEVMQEPNRTPSENQPTEEDDYPQPAEGDTTENSS